MLRYMLRYMLIVLIIHRQIVLKQGTHCKMSTGLAGVWKGCSKGTLNGDMVQSTGVWHDMQSGCGMLER